MNQLELSRLDGCKVGVWVWFKACSFLQMDPWLDASNPEQMDLSRPGASLGWVWLEAFLVIQDSFGWSEGRRGYRLSGRPWKKQEAGGGSGRPWERPGRQVEARDGLLASNLIQPTAVCGTGSSVASRRAFGYGATSPARSVRSPCWTALGSPSVGFKYRVAFKVIMDHYTGGRVEKMEAPMETRGFLRKFLSCGFRA